MSAINRKLDLVRTNSICPPPELVLLENVRNNNIDAIESLIRNDQKLLSYEYPSTKTILVIACSEVGIIPNTIQTLIDLNRGVTGNAEWNPLHTAAENPNPEILETILKNLKPGEINKCLEGKNALLSLIRSERIKENELKFCKNVELLLAAGINVNEADSKNISSILWAAKYGYKNIVQTILDKSIADVDLDTHTLRGKTARDLIVQNNLYNGVLPGKIRYQSHAEKLFSLIKQSKEEEFINYYNTLENANEMVNIEDNDSTLLQYSCMKGLHKITELLVEKGADVNKITKNRTNSPLDLAMDEGYFELIELLLEHPKIQIPPYILCRLIKNVDRPKFDKIDYEKCCQILLRKMNKDKFFLDINEEDEFTKNTVIHYALRYGNENIIQQILDLGASLAPKNIYGKMPVEDIKPEMLKNHLDKCIHFNMKMQNEDKQDFEVIFDYHNILPPRKYNEKLFEHCESENQFLNDEILPESEVIYYMSKCPEFKSLLAHPIIVSFLFMKWHKIRWLFYTNLLFYLCFVVSLFTYIFSYYGNFIVDDCNASCRISFVILNITFLILLLREIFQITVSAKNYFKNFENFVEIILIILTSLMLYIDSPTIDTRKQLASFAILLSAFELILMFGQHPKLSTNVVMFKTVSVNFFKLLLWYSLLIVAFAMSFYILFSKTGEPNPDTKTDDNDDTDLFMGPGKSLFKTIVMLTGEFDASSIKFQEYPPASKLIFSMFIFMITIILLNLLNGLAVSDTQSIKNDAELVGHITRAQHIYYVESMLLGDLKPKCCINILQKLFCCFPNSDKKSFTLKPFAKKICLFKKDQCCQLCILPNNNGKMYYEFDGERFRQKHSDILCSNPLDISLDKGTIKRTNEIIKNKRENYGINNSSISRENVYDEILKLRTKLDDILVKLATEHKLH